MTTPGGSPAAALAARSGLTERSFKEATGLSPLEHVQTLRIDEAEAGYSDGSFPRRLFHRMYGALGSAKQ